MKRLGKILIAIARAAALAILIYLSIKGKPAEPVPAPEERPVQVVDSMFAIRSKNGTLSLRLEADKMIRYENDSISTELFPEGFAVYGYNEEGMLETIIISDEARHRVFKKVNGEEWAAYGDVSIQNVIKRETMETDTLYWDQRTHEIYTDCYIRMYSPDGFMQGYGMRSDDKARNAQINKPFNSFGVVVQDTTAIIVDSVNFIGPFLKK